MAVAARGLLILCLAMLAGCQPLKEPPPQGPPSVPAEAPSAKTTVPAGERYTVTPADSELRILVYRSGALARLGHNHVVATHAISGEIRRRDGGGDFDLVIPVAQFEVDPENLRAEEGPEFASVPDAEARSGTRTNMLGDEVLDAARFPEVRAQGTLEYAGGQPAVHLQLLLKNRTTNLRVPITLREADGSLLATGQIRIQQSELGLEPFTAMGGLLAVDEEVTIRFRIAARRT